VLGADDRGVCGHAAIILLPGPIPLRVSTKKFAALGGREDAEIRRHWWVFECTGQAAE
jgi:hypothetical protein